MKPKCGWQLTTHTQKRLNFFQALGATITLHLPDEHRKGSWVVVVVVLFANEMALGREHLRVGQTALPSMSKDVQAPKRFESAPSIKDLKVLEL